MLLANDGRTNAVGNIACGTVWDVNAGSCLGTIHSFGWTSDSNTYQEVGCISGTGSAWGCTGSTDLHQFTGSVAITGSFLQLHRCTSATAPSSTGSAGAVIFISDADLSGEGSGVTPILAYSDGTNWRSFNYNVIPIP